ncbi:MAG: hypothetical protein Q4A01_11670 [Coriobacteriales bacterium]|nr:hypothetical protein [Coriobacteriales bacterium]
MKKTVSAAVMALMLCAPLTLGACSGQTQEASQDATKTQTEATTEDKTTSESATETTTEAETKTEVADTTASADEVAAESEDSAGEVGSAAEADSAGETTVGKKTSSSKSANVDNLVNWGIKIAVPEGATGVLKGNEYYIYTTKKSFPYVLTCVYNMDKTGDEFISEFTDYMKSEHKDLKVAEKPAATKIGDKNGVKTVYTYEIEGHPARDTRFVVPANGRVYMFATKEIDDLNLSAGDVYEQVIKDAEIYKATTK